MAARLFVSPWETLGNAAHRTMLDNVLERAYDLYSKGICLHDERMCEFALRYIDADLVLQFSDGTCRNDGPYIPF